MGRFRQQNSSELEESINTDMFSMQRMSLKLNSISIIYILAAVARLLYGFEGTYSHYTTHFDDASTAISVYIGAGVAILIAVALLLPLSRRLAILFVAIQMASGIIGLVVMMWFFASGEVNPATAPLVGGIMFSALLYVKPKITDNK